MMTSTLRLLAALGLAGIALGAGASQITGTGIGASNHPTVAGTSSRPAPASPASAAGSKGAAKSANSPRK